MAKNNWQGLEQVMNPIAKLFGMTPVPGAGGMIRVNDESGASIAIAAPLPGDEDKPKLSALRRMD